MNCHLYQNVKSSFTSSFYIPLTKHQRKEALRLAAHLWYFVPHSEISYEYLRFGDFMVTEMNKILLGEKSPQLPVEVHCCREPLVLHHQQNDSIIWHSDDRVSWYILIMEANEMHYFSNLFDIVLYMFQTRPLSIIKSISTLYMQ